jgi:hypothetical protein
MLILVRIIRTCRLQSLQIREMEHLLRIGDELAFFEFLHCVSWIEYGNNLVLRHLSLFLTLYPSFVNPQGTSYLPQASVVDDVVAGPDGLVLGVIMAGLWIRATVPRPL